MAWATELRRPTLAPNICGSSEWNLSHITLLVPTDLDRLLDFLGGKMCAFLLCRIYEPRFMKRRKSLPKWGGFCNGVESSWNVMAHRDAREGK
jgi:hypothetical protein